MVDPATSACSAASGEEAPAPAEVCAALDRVAASSDLQASKQLVAFLRFVVETTLAGDAARIKAYTIAVEALGRSTDFDPEGDSIVRVVAGRLRRALQTYYTGEGKHDPIVIELRRGSYCPVFRRRVATPAPVMAETSAKRPEAPAERAFAAQRYLILSSVFAVIVLVVIGLGAPRMVAKFATPSTVTAAVIAPASTPPPGDLRLTPVIFVQAFDATGQSSDPALAADHLRRKFADAIARFDSMNVVTDSEAGTPAGPNQYRFGGSVSYDKDGSVKLSLRLVDTSDGTQFWSRDFENLRGADDRAVDALVREVAMAVGSPFGIIWAQEAHAHPNRDPLRSCLAVIFQYWRSFDPSQHQKASACADRMVAEDPTSSQAFFARALVHYRAFLLDLAKPGEGPAIDLALEDALKADALKPDVALTYQLLSIVWFSRGDIAHAFQVADKALALKPGADIIIGEYGGQLIAIGQVEQGMAMIRKAAAHIDILPVSVNFHLFVGAYLQGDRSAATQYAALIENEPSPLGLLARALFAHMNDDNSRGRQAVARLVAIIPGWTSDPRRELSKYFPVADVRERLLRDLADFGVHEPG